MCTTGTLTEEQIKSFVVAWYQALDFHLPVDEVYTFLADQELDVQFPGSDIRDYVSFKKWYDQVTNVFFDENHYVQSVKATISGDQAVVDILVGWQASWWEAPAAKSKRTSMEATQRWTVQSSTKNAYELEIVTYDAMVEPFKYAPGFAQLSL